MAIFSFHPVKSITTGEGGAILTNSKDMYNRLLLFRNHGITKDPTRFIGNASLSNDPWYYEMQCLGFNYRITDIQCAIGIAQMEKIDRFVERRRQIAAAYCKRLSAIDDIVLPVEKDYAVSSWHIYCIRVKSKAQRRPIFEALKKFGLGVQVHYLPVYLQPYYQKVHKFRAGLCPKAENYYREAITLPLYPAMTDEEVEKVMRAVEQVFRKTALKNIDGGL
jgi:dTDP-4-amino-4,6-dideoxygalactose transaminase